MKTAREILQDAGLPPPPHGQDRYYATCPRCSRQRSTTHQKAKCLGISITAEGVKWGCNHCGFTGGAHYNGKDNDPVIGAYEYTDESGTVLFRKVRTAAKKFWQQHPDGHGGWASGIKSIRRVLYRLPELNEAIATERTILIVEGEKDADNLCRIGIPATCNTEGASEPGQKPKWRQDYSEALRDADVVIIPDHDAAGYAHAEAIAELSNGVAASIRILRLADHWPDCPKGGDVSDWIAAGHTREQLDDLIAQASPWTHFRDNADTSAPRLPYIDIARDPIPPRDWAVRDRIPARNVALLSGEGAVGKSTLLLQLAASTVLARDWIGVMPEPGPVIYLGCEDDDDETRRRLEAVAAHYNSSRVEMVRSGLHVLDFVGKDAVLGQPDRNDHVQPTPLFDQIKREATALRPKILIVDTVADVFAGNENNRSQTRQFITLMRRLALESGAAVILASHPSLTGISSDSGMSGSTAWHNGVRARGYFKQASEANDQNLRLLEWRKNNYGPISENIVLRWRNGVYVPEPRAGSLEQMAEDAKIDILFLELLRRLNKQGRNVTDRKSPSYAPAVFEGEPEAKKSKVSRKRFAEAMTRLFAANKILVLTEGPRSHPRTRIVEAES